MRVDGDYQPVGTDLYSKDILEAYASICGSPLNLPPALPVSYVVGLPDDTTLSTIQQYIYVLIYDFPSAFLEVVKHWHKRRRIDDEERKRLRELEMAIYGRTYRESGELKTHMTPRLTFELMLRNALKAARAKDAVALTTHHSRYRSTAWVTPSTSSDTGNRDEEDGSSDEEDARRLREVSPSPLGQPPTPTSTKVSPAKRRSPGSAELESVKRCRSSLERLASPLRSALPTLDSFPTFAFTARTTTSAITSASSRSTATSVTVVSSAVDTTTLTTPVTPEPVSPDISSEPPSWVPQSALPNSERTVLVTTTNPYQLLFWKKDIQFHVQWELERLVTRHPDLTWRDFQASDFDALAGNVREAVSRIESVVHAVQSRIASMMLDGVDDGLELETGLAPDIKAQFPKQARTASTVAPAHSASIGPNGIEMAGLTILDDATKRLCTEADREEMSIRAQDGRCMLSDDRAWPYGGKIAYTIYVCPVAQKRGHIARESRIQLHSPESETPSRPALSTLEQQQAIFSANQGPVDPPDNPLGPSSQKTLAPTYLPFSMTLAPPRMSGKSFRLARRFGSRRILNFKFKDMKSPKERQAMSELFVGRQFALFSRIFRAIWAPADKSALFAVEVSDRVDGLTMPLSVARLDPPMPTFLELVRLFNDLECKSGQAMAKWASRPQLLFSDSVPAVKIDPNSMGIIDDIVVGGLTGPATTEQTLTDGCGLMSETIARQVGVRLECQSGRPCVIQVRVGGAKGLLVLMTSDQQKLYPGKSVLLRKSMVKSLTKSHDPSLYIIDVVRLGESVIKTPGGLSAEAIIALNHRGIPDKTLVEMAKFSLDQLRDQFLPYAVDSEDANAMRRRLTAGLYGQGGIGIDRKKRFCLQAAKSARVAGLIHDDIDPLDLSDDAISEVGTKQDVDPHSGQPSSLAESIYMAIDAGFDPRESAFVCSKFHSFMDRQIRRVTKDFRIPVEQSLSAFIVPDPCGVLRPNEIYVGCDNRRPTNPETGCTMSHILGDVLAYRSPCKLPSDIRRFTAVYKNELRHLTDCIVMSTSPDCTQSPASFLAGGDYDGDTATIIFDKALVDPFVQAADSIATTPANFEEENFEKELVQGTDFLSALSQVGADEAQTIANYQTFLLGAVSDEPLAGLYSIWHDNAVYKYGHDHPDTIRLARMFSLVLDARKSGLRVKKTVFDKDRYDHSGTIEWRAHKKEEVDEGRGCREVFRPRDLPIFIMDRLLASIVKKGAEVLGSFAKDVRREHQSLADYHHLSATLHAKIAQIDRITAISAADEGAEHMRKELDLIRQHVATCKTIWDVVRSGQMSANFAVADLYESVSANTRLPAGAQTPSKRSPQKTKGARLENALRAAQMQQLSRIWQEGLTMEAVSIACADPLELKRLKIGFAAEAASYKWMQVFPLEMDFTTALQLKGEGVGATSTILMDSMMAKKPTWRAER